VEPSRYQLGSPWLEVAMGFFSKKDIMNDQSAEKTVNQSVVKEERMGETKTVYNASGGEVFWKNFLAGFGRALGSVFVYLLFLGLIVYLFTNYLFPQIKPWLDQYAKAIEVLTQQKGGQSGNQQELQQMMEKLYR